MREKQTCAEVDITQSNAFGNFKLSCLFTDLRLTIQERDLASRKSRAWHVEYIIDAALISECQYQYTSKIKNSLKACL